MPSTSTWLFPYPALTVAPNVPADMQALAVRAEAVRSAQPYRQAAGVVGGFSAGSLVATGEIHATANFPAGRFTVPPIVMATIATYPDGSGQLRASISDVTTTSCTIHVNNESNVTVAFLGLNVGWQATQMTATTAAG